jgi:glycosyltransferase involved in cell wall biosynthesis
MFIALADHFSKAPYHSSAIIRGPGWVRDQLERHSIPFSQIDSKGSVNVRFLSALIREIRGLEIDLVHAHLLGANVYCALAGWLTGVPVVSTFHGSVDISPNERFSAIKFAIVRRGSTIVAVSAGLRDEVAERMRMPPEHLRMIPNGIDCARFETATPLGLRHERNIPAGSLLIGSLGNVRPAKAYSVGLRALRILRDRGVDAHWCIAGQARPGDPLMADLTALCDQLELAPFVHFLGFVAAPERFLAEIDCFLLCSDSEGHPLALTQAMAAAKPIVATRCGVERILDEPGRPAGWLVPVQAPDELAQALQAASAASTQCSEYIANALAKVRGSFDNSAVFNNYQNLYSELLASRPRRVFSAH